MKNYEILVAMGEEVSEVKQKEILDQITKTIEKHGKVDQIENWGKRALAFQIKNSKNAFFTLINFTAEPTSPKALNDLLRVEELVLRYMISEKAKPMKVNTKKKSTKVAAKKLDELVVR